MTEGKSGMETVKNAVEKTIWQCVVVELLLDENLTKSNRKKKLEKLEIKLSRVFFQKLPQPVVRHLDIAMGR